MKILQNLSIQQLTIALETAFKRMGDVDPSANVFSVSTSGRIPITIPAWSLLTKAEKFALAAQVKANKIETDEVELLRKIEVGFIGGIDHAVSLNLMIKDRRPLYNLTAEHGGLPANMTKQEDILFWANKLIDGEAERVLQGGTPFGYPFSAAALIAQRDIVIAAQTDAKNKTKAHKDAQLAVADKRPEVKKLVKRMWKEIEAAFSELTPSAKRDQARLWGVIYISSKGETGISVQLLGVDNLPIAGHFIVSDGYEGDIDESGFKYLTEDNGLIVGDYTVVFSSSGYISQTVSFKIEKGKTTKLKITLVKTPLPPV